jgi:high-affinity Fe2+/Pb2+ permease
MNLIALASAIIGITILIFVVNFGNKIESRSLRYLSIIVGIIVAMLVAGNLPPLLGDGDVSTSAKAGEYMVYVGIIVVIIKSVFFKKKAGKEE